MQVVRAVIGELLDPLESLNEDDLHEAGYFMHMPVEWQPLDVIAGNTYRHYAEHLVRE
jgi:hypothetical protein